MNPRPKIRLADSATSQPEAPAHPVDRYAPADAVAPAPPIDRLSYRWNELPRVLGVPRRTLERAVAAGRFPKPDRRLGRVCLWSRNTIVRWLAGEGGR